MYFLARHYGEGPISLRRIAAHEKLSEHYLEQLISPLRKGGLVRSIRGAYGGYHLSYEPHEITVGDIIRILEGPIAPVECVTQERERNCSHLDDCVTRFIWKELQDRITQVLDSITLEDILQEEQKKKENGQHYIFHI